MWGRDFLGIALWYPGYQLDLDAGGGVGKLDSEGRARGRVLGKEFSVDFIHGVLLHFDVGEEDGDLQHIFERRAEAFQISLVQFENAPGLLLDVAAEGQR